MSGPGPGGGQPLKERRVRPISGVQGPGKGPGIDTRDGIAVITVTRLNGPQLAVNPDLIQRIESTPDTILTLVDGTKYVIEESPAEVADRIITFRATVVARTMRIAEQEEIARSAATADATDATVAAVTQLRPSGRNLSAVPGVQ